MKSSSSEKLRVLILGASGMLGHTLFRALGESPLYEVHGTSRRRDALEDFLPGHMMGRVAFGVDAMNLQSVVSVLDSVAPDVVVNCIGIIKQAPSVRHNASTIQLNSLLPHQLLDACSSRGMRLIHVSTDCVFSGNGGNYRESDRPDPIDLYGKSKLLGEVSEASSLTLRTSIVGRELREHRSLIDWFLAQTGVVAGYDKAIYSGLTTTEFAGLLATTVLPDRSLSGLYHIASAPISKYQLLRLVASEYGWGGEILPVDEPVCDRSLAAERFTARTGYVAPPWPRMIAEMHECETRWGAG